MNNRMEEIAVGNVERHLGDVCEGDDSPDAIYDEAYTLAFDALVDAGYSSAMARSVAANVAQRYAQP